MIRWLTKSLIKVSILVYETHTIVLKCKIKPYLFWKIGNLIIDTTVTK